jgi:IS5 family transposase
MNRRKTLATAFTFEKYKKFAKRGKFLAEMDGSFPGRNSIPLSSPSIPRPEKAVYGDSASMGKTKEIVKKVPRTLDLTQTRGTKNRKLTEEEKETNRLLSKTRSRGEHIFLIAKRIFGFSKVRYKGLAKNTNFVFVLFALSNLYMVRRDLLALTGA